MKSIRSAIIIFLSILLLIVCLKSVHAQGNQSDTTGPDPNEFLNQSDTTGPDPNEFPNQSDTAGSNPESTLNQDTNFLGNSGEVRVDREAFDNRFETAGIDEAVDLFEEAQAVEFGQYLGLSLFGEVASIQEISQTLEELHRQVGKKAAIIYVVSLKDQLQLLLILPNNQPIRQVVPDANRNLVRKVATELRSDLTSSIQSSKYRYSAQQLYRWIITPLESALQANQIDSLIFSMDSGLRSIPIAALYDGKQFLIEKYSVSIIPSFSLTDTRYFPLSNKPMLAVGISESTQGQIPLPGVAVEVLTLANRLWSGQKLLNEQSTLDNFKDVNRQKYFGIIHIATHAEFKPGTIHNSYIQFWNEKLRFDQLRQLSKTLGWQNDPKVELLVLSACRTALGDAQAELGFAGLTVQAGVKTALGSLWAVSDEGSLALMTKFYESLKTLPFKSEALQQAQLGMLKEQIRIENGKLRLDEQNLLPLPLNLAELGNVNLSHPYYWSAFTVIGNWN